MRRSVLSGLLAGVAFGIAFAGYAAAAPVPKTPVKTTAQMLYGNWEIVKSPDGPQPEGYTATVEFRKDGTHTLTVKSPNINYSLSGKWSADDGKIPYTMATTDGGERSETLTIKKLTDDELVTEDPDGQVEEFKRLGK